MKILFYLRIVVMGGAERYLLTLLPELKKRNIEVGFFCTIQHNNIEIIEYFKNHLDACNIPVYTCKASSLLSIPAAKELARVIRNEGYTILSAHLIHAEVISVLAKIFYRGSFKLITTKHGYFQKFMDENGLDYNKINKLSLNYRLEKFLQHFVDDNFAVSKGLADFFVHSGICSITKMKVIYHGLSTNHANTVDLPVRYGDNQVLIVARLRKLKGHALLIQAMKIIQSEIPDVKLVILGGGEEAGNLKEMVTNNGLNNTVIFAGHTDDVYPYIAGSDIIAAPSIAEAFGLVVLEAYSCSKPVIAFDVTALNENIIQNETGYLITPFSVQELADKIKFLLQNKGVAAQMGLNGKTLLSNKFSLDECVSKTVKFFENHKQEI